MPLLESRQLKRLKDLKDEIKRHERLQHGGGDMTDLPGPGRDGPTWT